MYCSGSTSKVGTSPLPSQTKWFQRPGEDCVMISSLLILWENCPEHTCVYFYPPQFSPTRLLHEIGTPRNLTKTAEQQPRTRQGKVKLMV